MSVSDLKRKLEECTAKAADDEEESKRLKMSSEDALAEAQRIKHQLKLQELRDHVEEIKLASSDSHGNVVRVALLVNQALQDVGDVDELTFMLPIGDYPGERHTYYDDSSEPFNTEEAKEGIYIKAKWKWSGTSYYFAKIFQNGTVEYVADDEDSAFNVLKDDPDLWTTLLCSGKPAE